MNVLNSPDPDFMKEEEILTKFAEEGCTTNKEVMTVVLESKHEQAYRDPRGISRICTQRLLVHHKCEFTW